MTLGAVVCLLAWNRLGRFPSRFQTRVLRTENTYVDAQVLDSVFTTAIAATDSQRFLDPAYDALAYAKAWEAKGSKRKKRLPLLRFGFDWRNTFAFQRSLVELTSITCPLFVPAILFAAYPTFGLVRCPLGRWRRKREGLCVKCGYDHTGIETGVCSDCSARCVDDHP